MAPANEEDLYPPHEQLLAVGSHSMDRYRIENRCHQSSRPVCTAIYPRAWLVALGDRWKMAAAIVSRHHLRITLNSLNVRCGALRHDASGKGTTTCEGNVPSHAISFAHKSF